MNIGLDFDGVITNVGKLKSVVAKKLFNKELPERDFDMDYAISNSILTNEEYEMIKKFSYFEKDALAFTQPVDGSIEVINKLLKEGHRLKVVTAREGGALENAKNWLLSKDLSIPIVGVGFGNNKKKEVSGLDVFVDDLLIQLYYLADIVPHRFLFSWGYNEKYDEKEYAIRVNSWSELYDRINSYC